MHQKNKIYPPGKFTDWQKAYDIICHLKRMDGAMEYDGSCSSQVIFKLTNGKTLRFCVCDDDVAGDSIEHQGLQIDQFGGLTTGEVEFFADKK